MRKNLVPYCVLTLVTGLALSAPPEEEKFEITVEEKAVLDLTNQERAKLKLPPLMIHPLLMQAAREHTKNMAGQEKMEHILDGKGPVERTKALGYKTSWVGENVAAGEAFFPKDVVGTWMNSKPHRENMLDPKYVYIGIGAARSRGGEYYYTQVFGRAPSK